MTSSSSRQQAFKSGLLRFLTPVADEHGLSITESAMGRLDLSGPGYRLSFFGPEGHEHKLNVTVATEEVEEGQRVDGIAIDWFVAFTGLPEWQPQPCRTARALEQAIAQLMVLLPEWLVVLADVDGAFWRDLRSFVR